MNRQLKNQLRLTFLVLDIVVMNLLYLFCQVLFLRDGVPGNIEFSIWFFSNISWLVISVSLRTYSERSITSFFYFSKRTVQVYTLWIIFLLFFLFYKELYSLPRLFVTAYVALAGVGLAANRFIYLGMVNYLKRADFARKKVMVLGYNDTAKSLIHYFEEERLNYQVVGFVEDDAKITELSHYPILGDLPATLSIAKEWNVHEIYSTITPEQNGYIYDLLNAAEKECIRFKIVPNLSAFIEKPVHVEYFNQLAVLSLRSEPLDDVGNRIKKRALDVVVSSLLILFILSWLIPILGLIILIESGRPIFFRQLRSGKNNEPFYCLKLRSMKVNKDANTRQATQNDARVTPFGKFLRKTSLDEIPQFINVIKGEMSLVGPRPHMIKHTNDYSNLVDEYMVRQFIKPGITGWAQINGYRGEINTPEQIKKRVNKDLWYLENWSLWLDIQILFLTVYFVLKGDDKAY